MKIISLTINLVMTIAEIKSFEFFEINGKMFGFVILKLLLKLNLVNPDLKSKE
jgi:hypothetical protein